MVTTDSPDGPAVVDGGSDARLDVVVVSLVLVLLLAPNQISVWIKISLRFYQIKRERGELKTEESLNFKNWIR